MKSRMTDCNLLAKTFNDLEGTIDQEDWPEIVSGQGRIHLRHQGDKGSIEALEINLFITKINTELV